MHTRQAGDGQLPTERQGDALIVWPLDAGAYGYEGLQKLFKVFGTKIESARERWPRPRLRFGTPRLPASDSGTIYAEPYREILLGESHRAPTASQR